MADIKWPKKKGLLGYRYDKGEHATMGAAEWRALIGDGGSERGDGDGTVALYRADGRRVAEVYLR